MNDNIFNLSPTMKQAIIVKITNGEPLKQIEQFLTQHALKKLDGIRYES